MFQAVLDFSYDPTEQAILIADLTDYVANGEPEHSLARFNQDSYYMVRIEKPDSTVHVISNQPGADTAIPSASLNILDTALVLTDSDPSGTYYVNLYSVPAWSDEESYGSAITGADTVFYQNTLWQSVNASVTSTPAVGNPDWAIKTRSTLQSKYRSESEGFPVTIASPTATGRFATSFVDLDGILNVTVDDECSHIEMIDSSTYDNGEVGHSRSDFSDYRFIRITKPTGEYYYMSSIAFDDLTVDQSIFPASSNNDSFYYLLDPDVDKDGVYIFDMCNYPTWGARYAYETTNTVIVFYNGELYKLLQNSTGNLPDEVDSVYWELYELTDPADEYLTRYCTCAKIAVLCLNTYKCYQELTRDAFCAITEDFCNDDVLCKNKKLLNTIKLRILIDEVGYAVNRNAWHEVVDIFNLIYKICGCR